MRGHCSDSKQHFSVHEASLLGRQGPCNGSDRKPVGSSSGATASALSFLGATAPAATLTRQRSGMAGGAGAEGTRYRSLGGFTEGRSPKSGTNGGEVSMIEMSSAIPRSSCGSSPRA